MFEWLRRWRKPVEPDDHTLALAGGPPPPPLFPRYVAPPPPRLALPVVWVPDTKLPQVTLAEVGVDPVELCPSCPRGIQGVYTAVMLVRLPHGTLVFGGGHFLTVCGDRFLAEQFPPDLAHDHAAIDAAAPLDLAVMDVDQEVLLVARYGLERWDEWVGALLPKIVLAEQAFPGRFAFLLPGAILNVEHQEGPWPRLAHTLATCGVAPGRVFAAAPELSYRFAALFAVSPVWWDGLSHPGALSAVRAAGGAGLLLA